MALFGGLQGRRNDQLMHLQSLRNVQAIGTGVLLKVMYEDIESIISLGRTPVIPRAVFLVLTKSSPELTSPFQLLAYPEEVRCTLVLGVRRPVCQFLR